MKTRERFLGEIIKALRVRGLRVQSPSRALGKSGLTHSFDVKVTKGSAKHLLIDVKSSEIAVNEISILRRLVKTNDVGAEFLLITQNSLSWTAKNCPSHTGWMSTKLAFHMT